MQQTSLSLAPVPEPQLAAVRPSRTSFKVHAENLDALRDRIDSLNKRV